MGMRGKITFIFKEKTFSFCGYNRRKIGGIRGGGEGTVINYGKMKKLNLKCEVKI